MIKKTCKLGPHIIKTEFHKKIILDKKQCVGAWFYSKNLIKILSTADDTKQEEAWWHEIGHAINDDRGSPLTEKQVELFLSGIYFFLKQNRIIK